MFRACTGYIHLFLAYKSFFLPRITFNIVPFSIQFWSAPPPGWPPPPVHQLVNVKSSPSTHFHLPSSAASEPPTHPFSGSATPLRSPCTPMFSYSEVTLTR